MIEVEKCHRRVEELTEYSDLSQMQQYNKEITKLAQTSTHACTQYTSSHCAFHVTACRSDLERSRIR